jgi:hypothetical protein
MMGKNKFFFACSHAIELYPVGEDLRQPVDLRIDLLGALRAYADRGGVCSWGEILWLESMGSPAWKITVCLKMPIAPTTTQRQIKCTQLATRMIGSKVYPLAT